MKKFLIKFETTVEAEDTATASAAADQLFSDVGLEGIKYSVEEYVEAPAALTEVETVNNTAVAA